MSLAAEQVNALLAPLNPARVRQVQGNAHLEAWDVRRWLIRIFGFGGWSDEVLSLECISERSAWDANNPLKGRHTVVYRCTMRLIVKDPDGNVLTHFDDGATGDSQNQPSLGDAHDMAMKTAMSQALKRCAMNLGDAFGLGLYDGGKTAAVVGKSLAHPDSDEHDSREAVTGGEIAPEAPDVAPQRQVSSPPVSDQQASAPAPASPAASPLPEAELAATLRGRVVTALDMPGQKGLIELGRVGIDMKKYRLGGAMVRTPDGAREVSLEVLLDGAMRVAGRKPAAGGNAHADAAAGVS